MHLSNHPTSRASSHTTFKENISILRCLISYNCADCVALSWRADVSYVGCFQEPVQGSHVWQRLTSRSAMTVRTCKQLARDAGYLYAGLQFYRECYAGNDTRNITQPGTCDTPCEGNKRELCGAAWTYSIYSTRGRLFCYKTIKGQSKSLNTQLWVKKGHDSVQEQAEMAYTCVWPRRTYGRYMALQYNVTRPVTSHVLVVVCAVNHSRPLITCCCCLPQYCATGHCRTPRLTPPHSQEHAEEQVIARCAMHPASLAIQGPSTLRA